MYQRQIDDYLDYRREAQLLEYKSIALPATQSGQMDIHELTLAASYADPSEIRQIAKELNIGIYYLMRHREPAELFIVMYQTSKRFRTCFEEELVRAYIETHF